MIDGPAIVKAADEAGVAIVGRSRARGVAEHEKPC
jgi:hypothetical protein